MKSAPSTEEVAKNIEAAVDTATRHVWWARAAIFLLRPIEYVLTLAYFGGLLYVGTWIVVLALRHSGAI